MGEINDMVKDVHETAIEKGWWETDRSALEIHALIHSEISEATEDVRRGYADYQDLIILEGPSKPVGESVELADAVIRIMDYFGRKGWDLEKTLAAKIEFNKTRPFRHGGKKA